MKEKAHLAVSARALVGEVLVLRHVCLLVEACN